VDLRVLFFVISSVIGSGIFFTPYDLQFLGINAFFSLIGVSILCVFIGYFFANSSEKSLFGMIEKNLGFVSGFFSSWLYWIISWTSTIIVVGEMYRYFCKIFPLFEDFPVSTKIFFIAIFTFINCFKNKFRNFIEISINVTKIVPMILFPILCFLSSKFSMNNLHSEVNLKQICLGFPQIMWCFIGIECGAIANKNSKITSAMIFGIIIVGIIYLTNLLGIFGVVGYKLASYTPYSDVMKEIFGKSGELIFSIIVFIVTAGALNVWIISSGEVAVDNSRLGYFPKIIEKKNQSGANFLAVLISSLGLIPLCFFETSEVLKKGVGMASNGVLIFYLMFFLAYFVETKSKTSLVIFFLCLFFLFFSSSMIHFFLIFGIFLLGLPLLFFMKKNKL
jgi:APA family basic amino acid/polyamine antiporter